MSNKKEDVGTGKVPTETNKESSNINTILNVINVSDSLKNQGIWLNKLQNLPGCKPILIKCLEGSTPAEADLDLYQWKYWKDVMQKATQPIYTRGSLSHEIVIDFDVKDWDTLKIEGDKLIKYLKSVNIPYLLAYSGGNGIHVHIFMQSLEFNLPDLKEYDIDITKAVRKSVSTVILQDANVKPDDIGLDKKKVNFSKDRMGSQVREFGTIRPDGKYKTLIETIPTKRPEVSLPLIFPAEVPIWDITETKYYDVAREAVKAAIERAQKGNTFVLDDLDFAGTHPMQYPCINQLLNEGLDSGRYYGAQAVLLMAKKCGMQKKEAEDLVKQFLKQCGGLSSKDVDLRVKNAVGMWDGDYKFSCFAIQDYIDSNLCKFHDCPIRVKIEEKKRNVEVEPATCVNSVDDIVMSSNDLIPPINFDGLPNYNFIKMFVDYITGIKDSYPEYAFQNGLAMLSTIVMRRVFVQLNGEDVFTNLWLLSLGLSGYARKSGPITISERIVKNGVGAIFLPADTTPEGLIAEMADIIETKKTTKDGSLEVVRDPQGVEGEPRKALYSLWKDEAGQHYAQLNKSHMQGLTEAYCYFHGCPDSYTKRLSAKRIIIDGPIYFGMNMTTTLDSFKKHIQNDEIGTGFLPRHLIVAPEYVKQRMDILESSETDFKKEKVITETLRGIHNLLPETPLRAEFQTGVLHILNTWAKEREEYFAQERDEQMSSLFAKLPSQVIRMAILIELGNIPQYIYEQLKEINSSYNHQNGGNIEQLKEINSSYTNLQEQSYEQSISTSNKSLNQLTDTVFDVHKLPKTIVLEKIVSKNTDPLTHISIRETKITSNINYICNKYVISRLRVSISSVLFAIKMVDTMYLPYMHKLRACVGVDNFTNNLLSIRKIIEQRKKIQRGELLRLSNVETASKFNDAMNMLITSGAVKEYSVKGKTKPSTWYVYVPSSLKDFNFKIKTSEMRIEASRPLVELKLNGYKDTPTRQPTAEGPIINHIQNYANTWQISNGPVNSSNIDTFVMNFTFDQAKVGKQSDKEEVKAAAVRIFKLEPKQGIQIVTTAEDTANMLNELQEVV